MSQQSRELAIAIGTAVKKDVPPWPDQCPTCPAVMTFGFLTPDNEDDPQPYRQCVCGTRVVFDGRTMHTVRAPIQP